MIENRLKLYYCFTINRTVDGKNRNNFEAMLKKSKPQIVDLKQVVCRKCCKVEKLQSEMCKYGDMKLPPDNTSVRKQQSNKNSGKN